MPYCLAIDNCWKHWTYDHGIFNISPTFRYPIYHHKIKMMSSCKLLWALENRHVTKTSSSSVLGRSRYFRQSHCGRPEVDTSNDETRKLLPQSAEQSRRLPHHTRLSATDCDAVKCSDTEGCKGTPKTHESRAEGCHKEQGYQRYQRAESCTYKLCGDTTGRIAVEESAEKGSGTGVRDKEGRGEEERGGECGPRQKCVENT